MAVRTPIGSRDRKVSLADEGGSALDPSTAWAAVRKIGSDMYLVVMPYHDQIAVGSIISWQDSGKLEHTVHVVDLDDVGARGELRLGCSETTA